MTLSLNRYSSKKKGQMHQVVKDWQRTGKSVAVLKEGLRLLSLPKRERASALIADENCEAASFIVTYGKGVLPKLALGKNDAKTLLNLINNVLEDSESEVEAKGRIEFATSVLFSRKKPSIPIADEKLQPLLKVMIRFDPTVNQLGLFSIEPQTN